MTLQQRDLLTKRWRKVKIPTPTENQIQIALVDRLKYQAPKNVVYFHVPNGGPRDKKYGALFKAMGTMPGVPDLIFFWPWRNILFLELKAEGRHPASAQINFAEKIRDCGWLGCWKWADNLDDAVKILQEQGILPRIRGGK